MVFKKMKDVEKRLTLRLSDADEFVSSSGTSFIKCCTETILKLILRSFLKYAYVIHNMHVRLSFRCEV